VKRTVSRCFAALRQLGYVRSAASYVPVPGDHPGAIQAGLRKRRTGWSSGLPCTSFTVGTECGRSADHITDALACLNWLRVPERIDYKVAVLTYKVLHGRAPRYLGPLVPVADQPGRRTLRSGGTNRLTVPSVRRSTVGDRAFTVAGPRVRNGKTECACKGNSV